MHAPKDMERKNSIDQDTIDYLRHTLLHLGVLFFSITAIDEVYRSHLVTNKLHQLFNPVISDTQYYQALYPVERYPSTVHLPRVPITSFARPQNEREKTVISEYKNQQNMYKSLMKETPAYLTPDQNNKTQYFGWVSIALSAGLYLLPPKKRSNQ